MNCTTETHSTTELPPFPSTGSCTRCKGRHWTHVEDGYIKYTSVEIIDGVPTCLFGGVDDFSEEGTAEWMSCDTCGATFTPPDHLEWY